MASYADLIGRRFGDGGPSGDGVSDNEFIRRVLSRKTVRRYSDAKPDENLLDVLVAAALSASAKSDFQQSSILRVSDPAKRAAIGALFPKMPWIGVSPVFFIFLGDARRLQRIGELRGKPVKNGTLEGFFNASVDAALAMQTMILCAEAADSAFARSASFATKLIVSPRFWNCPISYFPLWASASDIRRLKAMSVCACRAA